MRRDPEHAFVAAVNVHAFPSTQPPGRPVRRRAPARGRGGTPVVTVKQLLVSKDGRLLTLHALNPLTEGHPRVLSSEEADSAEWWHVDWWWGQDLQSGPRGKRRPTLPPHAEVVDVARHTHPEPES